ncbi:hypothetical protein WJ74_10505 [Burkholderia ubonensis]|uniref:endonuclease/exonuclease/phosphatase family protein n=1 Tax=Burkholderia ubonensis TaxID=101571 RepID=UPI00075958A6|nr:hypothetical protein [Burkholderia ubonensis]KVO16193.1 hypothetical protein WJ74_10505 [Burkholderia ubonensis]
MNELEIQSRDVLEGVLSRVPIVNVDDIRLDLPTNEGRIALFADIRAAGKPYRLLCEVLPNGQPRYVRHALLRLREHAARAASGIVPILIAPYFWFFTDYRDRRP